MPGGQRPAPLDDVRSVRRLRRWRPATTSAAGRRKRQTTAKKQDGSTTASTHRHRLRVERHADRASTRPTGIAIRNRATTRISTADEVDRHPPQAVRDRGSDGDRRADREPDERQLASKRDQKRQTRSGRRPRSASTGAHSARVEQTVDRRSEVRPAPAQRPISSRPSRAIIALVSSHAAEIDNCRMNLPFL